MNLNEYQTQSAKFTKSSIKGNLTYSTLGLVGEAGEVAEKVKKHLRDNQLNVDDLAKELGDVLWYLARLCDNLNINLSDVAQTNLEKLQSRQDRNVISGSGDDR